VVEQRERYGDWEGDTVVGPRHQTAIVTVVDRKSGYLLTQKARNRKAASVFLAVRQPFSKLSSTVRKTMTVDNGTEFSDHQRLAAVTSMNVYFALPYCCWQRGTNENTKGLIRRFFPKSTDFRKMPSEKNRRTKSLLNHRPRKRHGYKTPHELIGRYLRCA
jgi:IS30 family transposase